MITLQQGVKDARTPPARAPQTPTTEEQLDSGLWLEFLERLAVAHDRLRPDHLRLMHERGARRMTELKLAKLPMEPTEH
jgi:hypothetical protein